MQTFTNFDDPCYDSGATTNYHLPPRWLRPVISALVCSRKGHDLKGWSNITPKWRDEGHYSTCKRCAARVFESAGSRKALDEMLLEERERWKKQAAASPDKRANKLRKLIRSVV